MANSGAATKLLLQLSNSKDIILNVITSCIFSYFLSVVVRVVMTAETRFPFYVCLAVSSACCVR